MTQDEIIEMAKTVRSSGYWDAFDLMKFAKLVAAKERESWRNAAIRVGENLATCGPAGYYDFTAQQWLDWALDATTKMQDDYMNLGACGEREACAMLAQKTVCDTHIPTGVRIYGTAAAKAIRARGEA